MATSTPTHALLWMLAGVGCLSLVEKVISPRCDPAFTVRDTLSGTSAQGPDSKRPREQYSPSVEHQRPHTEHPTRTETTRRPSELGRGSRCAALPEQQLAVPIKGGVTSTNTRWTMVINNYTRKGSADIISRSVHRTGKWEIDDPNDMIELFRLGTSKKLNLNSLPSRSSNGPRPTFLDIGGNLGYYSYLFASFGYNVVAIEPMPSNRRALNATACLNPELAARVQVIPVAVGSPKSAHLECRVQGKGKNVGNGVVTCAEKLGRCKSSRGECTPLRITTIDALLQDLNLATIDVVKADIEGLECEMLEGATSLFTKYQPKVVQFEEKYVSCIRATMEKHGYVRGEIEGHDGNRVYIPAKLKSRLKI